MTKPACFLAIDLGAGSGRAILGGFDGEGPLIEEVRRFHYAPVERGGYLRWDAAAIFREVEASLGDARKAAGARGADLVSVGVDSWGVDFGFVDEDDALVEDPVCYRDKRNNGMIEAVTAVVPREEMFARTGIQFLPFNTVFQLYAQKQAGFPRRAARILMIPDLVHGFLCGRGTGELTNASTTQMLSLETGDWDRELMDRLGLPTSLLPSIVPPGTDLGPLRAPLAANASLPSLRVVAPATHDTGSAVAGTPLKPGWAYVSSGTWSLVGVERRRSLATPEVAKANFTNEAGAYGTVRFLKNVMGLWILESCRKEWAAEGREIPHARLLADVARREAPEIRFDPDDARFLAPKSMLAEIRGSLTAAGHEPPDDPVGVAKIVLDSLAHRYAEIVDTIEALTGDTIPGLQIVGGGSQNDYLNQATADAAGRPVQAGPVEATAIGNLLVQAVAAGRFPSLAAGRTYVSERTDSRSFVPRTGKGRPAS